MEKDLGVPVGTLNEPIGVFNILDGALFTAFIRNLKGLVKEFNFGGSWVLIAPVNGNDEFDPITMFQGKISNLEKSQN